MKISLSKFLIFLLLTAFFIPLTTEAVVRIENPLEADNFWELLDKLIDFLFYLAIMIAPIMIIVAGFYFITAAGQPEKIQTAKKIILWVLIGLLIVFCAKGLIMALGEILGIEFEVPAPSPQPGQLPPGVWEI